MNEWPKVMTAYYVEAEETEHPISPLVEVIPADLGQELYEALNRLPHSQRDNGTRDVIARYEREVGE